MIFKYISILLNLSLLTISNILLHNTEITKNQTTSKSNIIIQKNENSKDDESVNSNELAELNTNLIRKQKSKQKKEPSQEQNSKEASQDTNRKKNVDQDNTVENCLESNMEEYTPDKSSDEDNADTIIEENITDSIIEKSIPQSQNKKPNIDETIVENAIDAFSNTSLDESTDTDDDVKTVSCITKTDISGFKVQVQRCPARINKKKPFIGNDKKYNNLINSLVYYNFNKFFNLRLRIPVKSNLRFEVKNIIKHIWFGRGRTQIRYFVNWVNIQGVKKFKP